MRFQGWEGSVGTGSGMGAGVGAGVGPGLSTFRVLLAPPSVGKPSNPETLSAAAKVERIAVQKSVIKNFLSLNISHYSSIEGGYVKYTKHLPVWILTHTWRAANVPPLWRGTPAI